MELIFVEDIGLTLEKDGAEVYLSWSQRLSAQRQHL